MAIRFPAAAWCAGEWEAGKTRRMGGRHCRVEREAVRPAQRPRARRAADEGGGWGALQGGGGRAGRAGRHRLCLGTPEAKNTRTKKNFIKHPGNSPYGWEEPAAERLRGRRGGETMPFLTTMPYQPRRRRRPPPNKKGG